MLENQLAVRCTRVGGICVLRTVRVAHSQPLARAGRLQVSRAPSTASATPCLSSPPPSAAAVCTCAIQLRGERASERDRDRERPREREREEREAHACASKCEEHLGGNLALDTALKTREEGAL